VLIAAASREVWWIDSRVDVKLTAEETGGHAGMWLWTARQGAAAPLHVHRREDEQFIVLDGTARFVIAEEQIDAGPGDLVILPRDVPHSYLVTSPTARLLGSVTPGGFEAFFSRAGTPVAPGEPEAPPPAMDVMAAAGADLGIEIVGPPPVL
jgi:quercetin dioxygenase-like cupin family protein